MLELFLLVAGAHFLALLSPGPDFFLLVRQSLAVGRRRGYLTALGIAAANGVYILMALAGLQGLARHAGFSRWLLVSGAVYLAWLGWAFWRAAAAPASLADSAAASSHERNAWLAGFLSGALNPKNALFYATLFGLLCARGMPLAWQAACGAWMLLAVLLWDGLVAWAAGHPTVMRRFAAQLGRLHRAAAVFMWLASGSLAWQWLA